MFFKFNFEFQFFKSVFQATQLFVKFVLYFYGFADTSVIWGLFSVFFLLLEISFKGVRKFVSLSTILINSSDDKLILYILSGAQIPSPHFPVIQILWFVFFYSLKFTGWLIFFFTFREIRLIFHNYKLCMMIGEYDNTITRGVIRVAVIGEYILSTRVANVAVVRVGLAMCGKKGWIH